MKKLIRFILAVLFTPIFIIAVLVAMLVTWIADDGLLSGHWKRYWITDWKNHVGWYLFK